jgi:UDP-galactopyranose mutase
VPRRADYLVVGSGLTGATIARQLTDAGFDVLVLERRSHAGGNVHDSEHASGIRVHTYGPHSFRTNDESLWAFVNGIAPFRPFEAVVKALVNGRLENWPVAASCVARMAGPQWKPSFTGEPLNFEEAALAMMPREVYEAFVRGYTEKQWGRPAATLAASLARRFDVRADDEPRLSRHRFQGIPEHGYANFMQQLLRGIEVLLDCDYLEHRADFEAAKSVVYTGPIDEFFGFDAGRLAWRGQRREHEWQAGAGYAQPCLQVNNPGPADGAHIRTIEWKHLMRPADAASTAGTLLTREYPVTPEDPGAFEYPFPDESNARLYEAYRERAQAIAGLLVCGRLGEYRYYDMDQAIARARLHARRLLARAV